MTNEKFVEQRDTLQHFLQTYCTSKHKNQSDITKKILYDNQSFDTTLCLCDECLELFDYSIKKLQECPYEEKPRCRNCKTPCYEKQQWKTLAKIMRYSGLKLGLIKIKNKFFS